MISNKNSIFLILCLIVIAENIILITEIYCPALKKLPWLHVNENQIISESG